MKKIFSFVMGLLAMTTLQAANTEVARLTLTGQGGTESSNVTLRVDPAVSTAQTTSFFGATDEIGQVNIYAIEGTATYSAYKKDNLSKLELQIITNRRDAADQHYTLTFNVPTLTDGLTLFDRATRTATPITHNGTYEFDVNTTLHPDFVAGTNYTVKERFYINYVAPTWVYMNGDFDNPGGSWESWPGSFTPNGTVYSQELTLAADEWYHFQLIEEYSPDKYTAADGSSFDRDNNSHNLYVNEFTSALLLHTDVAGTYTFTWNDLTDNLTITFPAAPAPSCVTVRDNLEVNRYYTICLPQDIVSANGASFWNLSRRGEGVAYLEEAELPLEAGRPYIFQAEAEELCVVYGNAVPAASAGAEGALVGTFVAMDQSALDAAASAAGSDIYLLYNNTLWLANGQSGNNLPAYRAYINYDAFDIVTAAPQPAPGRRVRAIPMANNAPTGFESIKATETPTKMIIDGKMYILRGEQMFDATGRIVK